MTRQYPVHGTGNHNVPQDPFDTQMEVPFSEDTVEPVFKKPEMTDFEIPPVLEEMIPDGSLIHKHLPKQADIDKILTQINRKYLRRMHLPCSLKDMQAAYMQSPHFCDIYGMHQQDHLLLSQLHLTFPSSMDGVRSRNRSKLPRPSELDNQTPPTMLNRA